jgi:hypothetical protein
MVPRDQGLERLLLTGAQPGDELDIRAGRPQVCRLGHLVSKVSRRSGVPATPPRSTAMDKRAVDESPLMAYGAA